MITELPPNAQRAAMMRRWLDGHDITQNLVTHLDGTNILSAWEGPYLEPESREHGVCHVFLTSEDGYDWVITVNADGSADRSRL